MTPSQAARAVMQRKVRVRQAMRKAASQTVTDVLRRALRMSSGTFMAHGEYAVRDPRPPFDPAIINTRTGMFRARWHVIPVGINDWDVINDAPYAGFMRGTRLMIPRPIEDALQVYAEQQMARHASEHLARAFK